MELDYTNGCVNFRDVGAYINLLLGKPVLRERCLYRGGKLNFLSSLESVDNPKAIVNLRKGVDPVFEGVDIFHFPISNDYEKYDTSDKVVRRWLNAIMDCFTSDDLCEPVLIHCTSGKDRTGVVVAALLKILNIPNQIIIEEYLLSDGEVKKEWIQLSLDGMGDPFIYFNRVKALDKIISKYKIL